MSQIFQFLRRMLLILRCKLFRRKAVTSVAITQIIDSGGGT